MFGVNARHPDVKQRPLGQGQHLVGHRLARGLQLFLDHGGWLGREILDCNSVGGRFRQNLLLPRGQDNGAQGVMPFKQTLPSPIQPPNIQLAGVNFLVEMIGILQIQAHHLPNPIGMLNIGEGKGGIPLLRVGHNRRQLGCTPAFALQIGENFLFVLANLCPQFRRKNPLRGLDAQLTILGPQGDVALL